MTNGDMMRYTGKGQYYYEVVEVIDANRGQGVKIRILCDGTEAIVLPSDLKPYIPDDCSSDPVHHPDHYTSGGIESIDYINAKLSPEAFQGFCLGNVLKYVGRAGKKGDERTQDLEKAGVYLRWALDSIYGRKLMK